MRNDLTSILRNEASRYANKGCIGILAAAFFSLLFLVVVPEFWKIVWPIMLQKRDSLGMENWKFMVLLTTLWHAAWVLAANLVFAILYHLEIPFFESYKISQKPWPWKKEGSE